MKRGRGGSSAADGMTTERRIGKHSPSHSVGSRGTNCLLTAVHASISIVPGDNNSMCDCVSVCAHVITQLKVAMRWQTEYGGATENMRKQEFCTPAAGSYFHSKCQHS